MTINKFLSDKKALLLDMNSTFMFGEDRFGDEENYHEYYKKIGGQYSPRFVNELINNVYNYLDIRYTNKTYQNNFPSVDAAINTVSAIKIKEKELQLIIDTISFHEHGHITSDYVSKLYKLQEKYILALVIDIWSPKERWLKTFKDLHINELFSASSFSSDHGHVKPSPHGFIIVLEKINIPKEQCLVIGDSPRRDLGGARAAGIDCVLVGGKTDPSALEHFQTLLEIDD